MVFNLAHRIGISASTQKNNIGVDNYGTEQDRMHQLADRVKYWLESQGKFTCFRNQKDFSLDKTIQFMNNLALDITFDLHSDAGESPAEGTTAFYHNQGGPQSKSYRLASCIYNSVSKISPGKDRGVIPDNSYVSGLAFIQKTEPTACLIEVIFHTNHNEVKDFIARLDTYALAIAKGVCDFYGEKWIEQPTNYSVESLVAELTRDSLITDTKLWVDMLKGKIPLNLEWLQILLRRATEKIR